MRLSVAYSRDCFLLSVINRSVVVQFSLLNFTNEETTLTWRGGIFIAPAQQVTAVCYRNNMVVGPW